MNSGGKAADLVFRYTQTSAPRSAPRSRPPSTGFFNSPLIDFHPSSSDRGMVKDKPASTRVYDEEGFRRRAAGLCLREAPHEEGSDGPFREVLLVSSRRSRDKWVVPGGGVEPNEMAPDAAQRECLEEAGVMGHVGQFVGVFENPERKHRTSVYLLTVTEERDEWEDAVLMNRVRRWFALDSALALLSSHKPIQCDYIRRFLALVPLPPLPRPVCPSTRSTGRRGGGDGDRDEDEGQGRAGAGDASHSLTR